MNILAFALIGGVLNRFSGWTDYLPGRNIYYASLAALALTWYFYGPLLGALVFISFLAYRLPGWYKSLDMGTVSGDFATDFLIMFVRGLFFVPVFAFVAISSGNYVYPALLLTGASFLACLSYMFGNHVLSKHVKDPFWVIEFLAGASFGTALALLVGK